MLLNIKEKPMGGEFLHNVVYFKLIICKTKSGQKMTSIVRVGGFVRRFWKWLMR